MKTFLTKSVSLILVLVMACGIVPMVKFEAEAYYSVSRDDGVWLFPLDSSYYYSFTDFAGCVGYANVACPFCGYAHPAYADGEGGHQWQAYYGGHNGIDIGAPSTANVYAPANGVVIGSADDYGSRGHIVMIKHDIGNGWAYYSYSQHLSVRYVSVGQTVSAGTIIGKVGNTGVGTGAHLHFGIVMAPTSYTFSQVLNVDSSGSTSDNNWVTTSGYKTGKLVTNPRNGGTNMESVNEHRGSVTYTFDKNKVSLPNTTISTTGISLNTGYSTVDIGESVKLTATVSPSNATNKNVTWSSNNTSVATVSGGTVKGVKAGMATITAKASGGQTATCKIVVFPSSATPTTTTEYNGHLYELYDYTSSWKDAKEFCEAKGGHLVTITSKAENDAVYKLAQKGNKARYCLGATDEKTESTWLWVTGEKFSYSNFQSGENTDSTDYKAEDYLFMYTNNGKWGDVRNYAYDPTVNGFICEYDYISEPTLPEGADPDDYEKVTEYRYRDKQTTTSTASSMSGWTLYDSKVTYGTWSKVQSTKTKPTTSDTLQITGTWKQYHYYHYCNYYYNGGNNWNVDSIAYGSQSIRHDTYLNQQLPAISFPDQGNKQAYGGTGASVTSACDYNFYVWFYAGETTFYNYQTRTKTTTNHFYKYGAWSAWSTTPVTATSNRQVETRTVYKLKDHKHTSSSWITDKKATVNATGKKYKECTECGKILETATIAQLKCSKPNLSKISNTLSGVKVTWGKVSGADKYRVYCKTSKSDWTYIGSTSKTSYTDKTAKSGNKYYYAIKARNEAGNSSLSKSLSIRYLDAPKLSKVSSTTKGVKFTWGKVSGAEEYRIYRKTSKNGEWKYLDTTSKTYFTDKSVKSGKTYYYTARAYNGSTKSYYNTTGLKIKFLSTPKISSVKNTTSGIKVTWNKISSAKGYIVYRKTGSGDWKQLGKVTSGKTVSFTDKKYNNNTTYKYTVRAYSGDYKSSYYSDKGKIKAVIKGDITSSNVKSVFLPILKQVSSADNGYYAVGLVKDKNGVLKDYRDKVPTDWPDDAVLGIYKFKSVKSISELKTYLKKYMTSTFIEDNCYFDMLIEYNGSLYVIHGARGSTTYNGNSIKLIARHGNGYYISADSYGSGDNYFETVTFYVKKVNGRYVVDDIVSKKQLHNWDYTSPDYEPLY